MRFNLIPREDSCRRWQGPTGEVVKQVRNQIGMNASIESFGLILLAETPEVTDF